MMRVGGYKNNLITVYRKGLTIFSNHQELYIWMQTPHKKLGNDAPFYHLNNEAELQLVLQLMENERKSKCGILASRALRTFTKLWKRTKVII